MLLSEQRCPRQESNLVCNLRRVACGSRTLQGRLLFGNFAHTGSAWIRTRNASFKARCDDHFTTEPRGTHLSAKFVIGSTRTRTRNASFEARHDVHFTIEPSGRRGIRTRMPAKAHALAMRFGQPYPIPFHSNGPPGTRTPISWVQTKRRPFGPVARLSQHAN